MGLVHERTVNILFFFHSSLLKFVFLYTLNIKRYKDSNLAEINDIGLLGLWSMETESDLDFRIGMRSKGLLENVRIYDDALSKADTKALSNLQSSHLLSKSQ